MELTADRLVVSRHDMVYEDVQANQVSISHLRSNQDNQQNILQLVYLMFGLIVRTSCTALCNFKDIFQDNLDSTEYKLLFHHRLTVGGVGLDIDFFLDARKHYTC